MFRAPFLLLLLGVAAFAQNPNPAPDGALQALLAEIHQLRLDLQATTVTSQRVQILLYRVQLQQANAARVANHADDVHTRLMSVQQARARAAQAVQQSQDMIDTGAGATDPTILKHLQLQVKDEKQTLENLQNDEQQWQAKDAEAQSQLRAEQARLDSLQETLDKLDQTLAALAKQ